MTSRAVGASLAAVPLGRQDTIRPARDEDAPGLTALIASVYAEYPGCVLDPDGVDADLAAWASHLASQGGTGWVLTDAHRRVSACVGVVPVDGTADAVELKRLYVAADRRQRGLGAALVGLVEGWAADRGRTRVLLWSDTRFADAHRLYQRLGYRRTGETRRLGDPSDTVEEAFVLMDSTRPAARG